MGPIADSCPQCRAADAQSTANEQSVLLGAAAALARMEQQLHAMHGTAQGLSMLAPSPNAAAHNPAPNNSAHYWPPGAGAMSSLESLTWSEPQIAAALCSSPSWQQLFLPRGGVSSPRTWASAQDHGDAGVAGVAGAEHDQRSVRHAQPGALPGALPVPTGTAAGDARHDASTEPPHTLQSNGY